MSDRAQILERVPFLRDRVALSIIDCANDLNCIRLDFKLLALALGLNQLA